MASRVLWKMPGPVLLLAFLIPSLLPPPANARTCTDYARFFRWVSLTRIHSTLRNIAVQPPYGYVTDEGYGLRVLDLSDPLHAEPLTTLALPGQPWDVCLAGKYACVSVFDQGLQIVDVGNPGNPAVVGSVWTGSSIGLATAGDYVFLADFFALRLYSISIQDPAHPEIVAELPTPGWPWDVAITGKLAVVTATYAVMTVDISNPVDPRRIGSVAVPDAIYDVAIERHHAFVAGSGRFYVVDFEDPVHPVLVANVEVPSMNWTIAVKDGFAFLGRQENGVTVFDVHDPAHPVPVGHLPGWAWGLDIAGGLMYVVDPYSGPEVVDVSNPVAVRPLAIVATPDPRVHGIAIAEPYAYLADVEGGLLVTDLSLPASPRIIAQVDTDGDAWAVAHENGRVYLAGENPALTIFDVTDPDSPLLLGSTQAVGSASCVEVQDEFAYVSSASGGFRIVDASVPANPRVVGGLSIPANDIVLHGHFVYLTTYGGGLTVVDAADPAAPYIIDSVDVGFPATCIAGDEGNLFIGSQMMDYTGEVAVLSIEDPVHPAIVSSVPIRWGVRDIEVRGSHVWVSQEEMPVLILDVSEPADPRVTGYVELADSMGDITWDLAVGDQFVLGGNDGLQVLPCHLPVRIVSGPPDPKPRPLPVNLATIVSDPAHGVRIPFQTRATGPVRLEIFDPTGRIIRQLASSDAAAEGAIAPYWDFRNAVGQRVAPGIYFARMTTAAGAETKRVIVLR